MLFLKLDFFRNLIYNIVCRWRNKNYKQRVFATDGVFAQTRTVEYHNGAETYNADRLGSPINIVYVYGTVLIFF